MGVILAGGSASCHCRGSRSLCSVSPAQVPRAWVLGAAPASAVDIARAVSRSSLPMQGPQRSRRALAAGGVVLSCCEARGRETAVGEAIASTAAVADASSRELSTASGWSSKTICVCKSLYNQRQVGRRRGSSLKHLCTTSDRLSSHAAVCFRVPESERAGQKRAYHQQVLHTIGHAGTRLDQASEVESQLASARQ